MDGALVLNHLEMEVGHDSASEKFKKCIECKFCTAQDLLSIVSVGPNIYNANDHYLLIEPPVTATGKRGGR